MPPPPPPPLGGVTPMFAPVTVNKQGKFADQKNHSDFKFQHLDGYTNYWHIKKNYKRKIEITLHTFIKIKVRHLI